MGGSLEGAKCSEKYSVAVIERVDRGTGSSASRSHDSRFAFFWPESGRSYENCVRSGLVSGRPQSGHALAVGGTWAWLVTHSPAKWTWFIPVLFVVLGILRCVGVYQHFGQLHEYLKQIESAFSANDDPGGWEHFLQWQSQSLSKSSIAFWSVLLFAAIGVALYECSR